MDIGTISSRYAKALFSLAKEKGLETRVYDDMKMLADSFSLEPGLRVGPWQSDPPGRGKAQAADSGRRHRGLRLV